jgi:hypothetical protein
MTIRVLLVLVALFAQMPALLAEGQSGWQAQLEWAIRDFGNPDCRDEYLAIGQAKCLGAGRACLMQRAIVAARNDDCGAALTLSLTTQCHNESAQRALKEAGPQVVCAYLRTR